MTRNSDKDIMFEEAMFEWFQGRSKQLLGEPNHPEFQARYQELLGVFGAMIKIKHAMLSPERQAQVADMLESSFSGS